MNAVRSADLWSIAELVGAHVEQLRKQKQSSFDDVGSIANLQRLRGVDDIVGSQTVMEPARGSWIADGFADVHGEGDDIMLHAGFEFVNARDIHFGARA